MSGDVWFCLKTFTCLVQWNGKKDYFGCHWWGPSRIFFLFCYFCFCFCFILHLVLTEQFFLSWPSFTEHRTINQLFIYMTLSNHNDVCMLTVVPRKGGSFRGGGRCAAYGFRGSRCGGMAQVLGESIPVWSLRWMLFSAHRSVRVRCPQALTHIIYFRQRHHLLGGVSR